MAWTSHSASLSERDRGRDRPLGGALALNPRPARSSPKLCVRCRVRRDRFLRTLRACLARSWPPARRLWRPLPSKRNKIKECWLGKDWTAKKSCTSSPAPTPTQICDAGEPSRAESPLISSAARPLQCCASVSNSLPQRAIEAPDVWRN